MTIDNDGNLKIHPPVTAEEHLQVQREEKARTILLSALPDEHMGDFYHMIDAKDIWNAIKARFGRNAKSKKMQKFLLKQKFEEFKISKEEGFDKGFDKMQKILTQMNTLKIKPKQEDVNMKFLRGLPLFWSGIALILKTKGGLEYISFDNLYNKLKFLEIDPKGYLSSLSTLSNAVFVSTAGSSQGNLSYQESGNNGYTTTLSVSPGSSSSKGSSKSKCNVVDDVIYSFSANHDIDQHLVYEDLNQMNKEEFEEYDLKHQMEMLSIKIESDADSDGEVVYADNAIPAGVSVSAGDVAAVVSPQFETDFALMGLSTEGKPIYNRFASVDHMKAVPPPLTGNYMPPSNIPDIDESQMMYGKKATDSSEIKTNDDNVSHSNDFVLFDFSDSYLHLIKDCDLHEQRLAKRNAKGKGKLGRRPIGKPVNPNRPKPVSAGQQNPVSAGLPNSISTEQQNTVFAAQPNPVSAGQPNPVSASKATLACNNIPLSVSAGDGILGPRPLIILSGWKRQKIEVL
nr:ribonuclease H-like domain-containing protein [Tanacetum cinerariifolium]